MKWIELPKTEDFTKVYGHGNGNGSCSCGALTSCGTYSCTVNGGTDK